MLRSIKEDPPGVVVVVVGSVDLYLVGVGECSVVVTEEDGGCGCLDRVAALLALADTSALLRVVLAAASTTGAEGGVLPCGFVTR